MSENTDPAWVANAASRLVVIKADIEALTAEANAIKEGLRAALGTGAHTLSTGQELSITPQRKFSPARAAEVLPPELLALCTVGVVDTKRAREVLPPAVYEQCKVESGQPVVRLG